MRVSCAHLARTLTCNGSVDVSVKLLIRSENENVFNRCFIFVTTKRNVMETRSSTVQLQQASLTSDDDESVDGIPK